MSRRSAVVVASTSVSEGRAVDRTGPIIASWLRERGFEADAPVVVPDGPRVGDAIRRELEAGAVLVVTTGGTGIGPGDATPQETAPLLDAVLPGIQEEIRRRGVATTPTALLSRGLAGVAGRSLVVNLPGSPGGVADGLAVLDEIVEHTLDQLAGGGHDRPDAGDRG